MTFDRLPPHNLEAEEAIIGACMIDQDAAIEAISIVKPVHFYAHVHETIFGVILELIQANKPVQPLSVMEELRKREVLERVGGFSYLASLARESVQTVASVRYYATLVFEKAQLRNGIVAASEMSKVLYHGEDDVTDAIGQADQMWRRVIDGGTITQAISADEAVTRYEQRLREAGGMIFDTPWPMLTRQIGGLASSATYLLAADSKLGKSNFAINLSAFIAERYGHVAYFPPDMGQDETIGRFVSLYSGISTRRQREDALLRAGSDIRAQMLSEFEREKLEAGKHLVRTLNLSVFDEINTLEDIVAQCRKLHRSHGLKFVVIDTLSALAELHAGRKGETKAERQERMGWALKRIARELDIVVLILHHLNQGERTGGRPTVRNIRDGGNLDGPVDAVLFLHADRGPSANEDRYFFIVERCRNGQRGDIPVRYFGARSLFLEGHDPDDAGYQSMSWFQKAVPEDAPLFAMPDVA